MKKVILITFLLISIVSSGVVFGQTNTATPSAEDKEIKALKEKIATKVAQLRQKDNKAVSGVITDIVANTIFIKTDDEKDFEIKLDDALTKYYQLIANQRKEIKQEDIKKGAYIIVTGVINEKSVNANSVYLDEHYLVKSGKISEVNKENFSLKVITSDKDTYTLDIETSTKQQIINIKTLEIERVGFSKIKEGDTIHFVVKKTGEEKDNQYSAQKILIIPQEYFLK